MVKSNPMSLEWGLGTGRLDMGLATVGKLGGGGGLEAAQNFIPIGHNNLYII